MAIDLALSKDATTGLFDVSLENGDFKLVDSFDTSMLVSLFTDARADESEVPSAELRRGWWGNEFDNDVDFEIGSKLWLVEQSRNVQDTLNSAIDFAKNSLQWLVSDGHAENIEVSGEFTGTNLSITLKIFTGLNKVETKFFDLWENSGAV